MITIDTVEDHCRKILFWCFSGPCCPDVRNYFLIFFVDSFLRWLILSMLISR
jgi:hypothetical protein